MPFIQVGLQPLVGHWMRGPLFQHAVRNRDDVCTHQGRLKYVQRIKDPGHDYFSIICVIAVNFNTLFHQQQTFLGKIVQAAEKRTAKGCPGLAAIRACSGEKTKITPVLIPSPASCPYARGPFARVPFDRGPWPGKSEMRIKLRSIGCKVKRYRVRMQGLRCKEKILEQEILHFMILTLRLGVFA